MSARSFASVGWVATVATAALGCYLVSLRVASERSALEDVETEIVLAQRDIRLLQTELGTRGRLAQLERWNVKVLALSAPSADQFVDNGFALARLTVPDRRLDLDAPVVLASAPSGQVGQLAKAGQDGAAGQDGQARLIHADFRPDDDADRGAPADTLIHRASLKSAFSEAPKPRQPKTADQAAARPVKTASPADPGKTAGDPLHPLAAPKSAAKSAAKATAPDGETETPRSPPKDSGSGQ